MTEIADAINHFTSVFGSVLFIWVLFWYFGKD